MPLSSRLIAATVLFSSVLTGCGEGSFLRKTMFPNRHDDDAKPGACDSRGVQRIALPQVYAAPTGGAFNYAFQHIPAAAGQPTIVYIPGGPGQTSIGDHGEWLADMPEGYGLVLTDPRGVGCNYADVEAVGEAFYTSEQVARDVLSAVKHLDLTNYTLYGISYGTVVATMAASIAETDTASAWTKPSGVMLEGVLARAFNDYGEVSGTYTSLWDKYLSTLSITDGADKADRFRSEPLPLGYDADTWHGAIQTGLMIGSIYYAEDDESLKVVPAMISAAVSDDADRQAAARRLVEALSGGDGSFTKGSDDFYERIACDEVFIDLRLKQFTSGTFVYGGENACAEAGYTGARRFDASKYPISAPIYYLQGEDDPATPAVLARQHFDGQSSSPARQFLLVKGAGHNPFRMNMRDCYVTVFAAMATQAGFEDAVKGCTWNAGFELAKVKDGTTTTASIAGGGSTTVLGQVDQLFDDTTHAEQLIKPLRGLLVAK